MECPAITEMGFYIRLDDEIEFKTAKKEGIISEEMFNKGYKIATDLMLELRENKNDIVNRCLYDLLRIKNKLNLN